MGCDIHAYTEYFKDNQWHSGDAIVTEEYYGKTKPRVPSRFRIWVNRNYNFFAWIANVRNNTWGESIPPISEPKGLPEDSCEFIKQEAENWNGDGHSHSYLTLAEIETAWQQSDEPLQELVKFPYNRIQDFLWNLQWDKQVQETEVRMVFWFDN